MQQVTSDDVLRYGMIPEFVGRLPVTVSVDPLDEESLMAILTEPKNSIIKQFQRLFALDNVELVFTPEALRGGCSTGHAAEDRRAWSAYDHRKGVVGRDVRSAVAP